MKILVSACLLGENCKYNGGNNRNPDVITFLEGKEIIPVCPEVLAGMSIPRTPIEICNGQIRDKNGKNVDRQLRLAVEKTLDAIKDEKIACAILQSRSPTCGVNQVYDGTFTGNLVPGSGVLAQALKEKGYCVIDAEDVVLYLEPNVCHANTNKTK